MKKLIVIINVIFFLGIAGLILWDRSSPALPNDYHLRRPIPAGIATATRKMGPLYVYRLSPEPGDKLEIYQRGQWLRLRYKRKISLP